MGYGYDHRGRLCCDNCGAGGGVRKRKCTYTVLGDSLHSGRRTSLHYCYPPALCADCLKTLGGSRALHAGCAAGAAASQTAADAIEAALDAGEYFATSAWGAWHEAVPEGKTGVLYRGRGEPVYVLLAESDYDRSPRPRLSEVNSEPWTGPQGSTTKRLS